MKRKISIFLCFAALVLLFSSCSSKDKKSPEIDLSELSAALLESGAFAEELELIDNDIGCYIYGMEENAETETLFYMSSGATADELTIFKSADEASASELEKSVSERLDYQKRSFEAYNPDEVTKLDGAVLKTSGVYVLLVVADDYDAANSVIDEYFKA